MACDAELARALEGLSAEYRQSLPERMRTIDALWSSVKAGDAGSVHPLLRAFHSIAGTGLTFGMAALSKAAAAAEDWLEPYSERGKPPPPTAHAELESLLEAVKHAATPGS